MIARPPLVALAALFCLSLAMIACQSNKRVIILVDGQRREVQTQAATVDEVLREQQITLGRDDRVDPPGYTPIDRTATVQIVRVEIKTEKRREPVEFARKLTRDEALADGKMRVVQLGTNGEAEITFQITFEDGKEISRREISRVVTKPPQDETLALGSKDSLAAVQVRGTLVYLAHGNAWVMRNSSSDKRPLTFEGDLDGRVFDLSRDGRYLLFTREDPKLLNSLWLADTALLEERPRRVPLDNLLYAEWAADGSAQIAYSTGQKTSGAPGWKASNDLYLGALKGITETLAVTSTLITPTVVTRTVPVTTTIIVGRRVVTNTKGITLTIPITRNVFSSRTVTATVNVTSLVVSNISVSAKAPVTVLSEQIIEPSAPAPYSWWGSNLAWAPDTRAFAFAFANQVGLVNVSTGTRRAVRQFAFYNTRADWVWTPQIAWSPDSRFIAATVHSPPEGAGLPEDSPAFDLWIFARDNSIKLALARNSGMWSAPAWSPRDARAESKLAFGVALNPANSERSRYALYISDRDGSNRLKIFPQGTLTSPEEGVRVVQLAWSPDVTELVAVRDGDLWLYNLASNAWSQLTANGDSRLPRWK